MTDIEQQERIEIFVGGDTGKGSHHAVALDFTGKRLLDGACGTTKPNFEHSVACCSWPISLRRSVACRLQWHELMMSQLRIFRACDVSHGKSACGGRQQSCEGRNAVRLQ